MVPNHRKTDKGAWCYKGDYLQLKGKKVNYLKLFNYCISLVMGRIHGKIAARTLKTEEKKKAERAAPCNTERSKELALRKNYRMKGQKVIDPGVKYLDDPFLPELSLDEFPRLSAFFDSHLTTGSKAISTHVFGDGQGTLFWGELDSVNKRTLSPYT